MELPSVAQQWFWQHRTEAPILGSWWDCPTPPGTICGSKGCAVQLWLLPTAVDMLGRAVEPLAPMKIIMKGQPFSVLADASKCAGPEEVHTLLHSTWKCNEKPVLDQKGQLNVPPGQLDVSPCPSCLLVRPTQFQSICSWFKKFLCLHGTPVPSGG